MKRRALTSWIVGFLPKVHPNVEKGGLMRSRKGLQLVALVSFCFLLVLVGCSEKATNSTPTDQDAILLFIESAPDVFRNEAFETGVPDTSDLVKMQVATVDSVKAWRRIVSDRVRRSVDIDIRRADSLHQYDYANVSIADTVYGLLLMVRKDNLGIPHVIHRPLKDVAKWRAYFERQGPTNSSYRGWWLIGISGLLVESDPCSRGIDSLHIVSSKSLYDTTLTQDYITDYGVPLRSRTLAFDSEDSITVTVYTADATDSVYLYAYSQDFPEQSYVRSNLVNNGDGSFTGSWVTPDFLSFNLGKQIVVNVIKHGTLDGDDPYDSKAWGMFYMIR